MFPTPMKPTVWAFRIHDPMVETPDSLDTDRNIFLLKMTVGLLDWRDLERLLLIWRELWDLPWSSLVLLLRLLNIWCLTRNSLTTRNFTSGSQRITSCLFGRSLQMISRSFNGKVAYLGKLDFKRLEGVRGFKSLSIKEWCQKHRQTPLKSRDKRSPQRCALISKSMILTCLWKWDSQDLCGHSDHL